MVRVKISLWMDNVIQFSLIVLHVKKNEEKKNKRRNLEIHFFF